MLYLSYFGNNTPKQTKAFRRSKIHMQRNTSAKQKAFYCAYNLPFWIIPKQRPDKRPHKNIYNIMKHDHTKHAPSRMQPDETTNEKIKSIFCLPQHETTKKTDRHNYIFFVMVVSDPTKATKAHAAHTRPGTTKHTYIYKYNISFHQSEIS